MNPSVWGPKLWFSLHTITLNYPKKPTYKDKKIYNNFFVSLQHIIPCSSCAQNFGKHLEKYPISENLSCRKDLVLWLIKVHNAVNKQLGKQILKSSIALKKISDQYKKDKLKCLVKKYNWTYILVTIALIIISVIIYFLIRRKPRHTSYTHQVGGRYKRRYTGIKIPKIQRNIYYGNRF